MARINVLLYAPAYETSYYPSATSCLQHFNVFLPHLRYQNLLQLLADCRKRRVNAVVTCDDTVLSLVLAYLGKDTTKPTCNKWAGARLEAGGILFVFTKPFSHIVKTSTGRWIFTRHVYKCLTPSSHVPPMNLQVVIPRTGSEQIFRDWIANAELVAVDIETAVQRTTAEKVQEVADHYGIRSTGIAAFMKKDASSGKKEADRWYWGIPVITMVGYTAIRVVAGKLESMTFVVHWDSWEAVQLCKWANASDAPKALQNGGYDSTYFIRYGLPLNNYVFDTYHAMHSWFSELPRKLDFIASIFIPDYVYWKDMMGIDEDYYNGLDTYTTAWCSILIMMSWPDWAEANFHIEFRKLFPNVSMGLEGVKVDREERERMGDTYRKIRDDSLAKLQAMVGYPLNPASPTQVLQLMNVLARPYKYTSSDEKNLEKWGDRHPLLARIAMAILDYRGAAKAVSTYLEVPLFGDRLLYELNAGGTATGRSASKASNLWVGTQIQNQDTNLRSMYVADEGYTNCSIDGSQAESRTTAYISQDLKLIENVETAPDFHRRNASLFFGIPEAEISKILRTLSKRVNHGANYNMAGFMLLQTMGAKNVMEAKRLLQLPAKWTLRQVCEHLLELFDKTYPRLRGGWYDDIIKEVKTTGLLRLPNGWTRRCFGNPGRERGQKSALNEYVAHKPQSLSVMLVDEGLFDFWLERQIKANRVRVKAQIHDEVIYQAKPEVVWEEAAILSKLLMRPIEVEGRQLVIPNNGGTVDERWSNLKD